jgi:hypothetical protein
MGSPLWKRGARGDFIGSFDSIGAYFEKYEARNPKFETIPNDQNTKFNVCWFEKLGNLKFDIVSDFDIRISNLRDS